MELIDTVFRILLLTLAGIFVAGVLLVGVLICVSVCRAFFSSHAGVFDSRSREAAAIVRPLLRRLTRVWWATLILAITWLLLHAVRMILHPEATPTI